MARWFISLLLLLGTSQAHLHACRYTVRDIGFVPLRGAEFSLVLQQGSLQQQPTATANDLRDFESAETVVGPVEWMRELKRMLAGSNVIPIAAQPESADSLKPAQSPTDLDDHRGLQVRLVDRSGRSFDLTDSLAGVRSVEQLENWSKELLLSPLIRSISGQSAESFVQLMIIEGPDPQENERAHQVADEALAALGKIEPLLPRPIAFPSRKIVVAADGTDAESLLLWSLGIDWDKPSTALAVIYGRGKLAGPVMLDDSIQLRETLSQLTLVGESCECETDRAWMDEASIPFVWHAGDRQRAANLLGFDPDSPLVRAEMLRIVSQGSKSARSNSSGLAGTDDGSTNSSSSRSDPIERLLMGYSESDLAANLSSGRQTNNSQPQNSSVSDGQEASGQEAEGQGATEPEGIRVPGLQSTVVDAPSSLRSQVITGGGWDFDDPQAPQQTITTSSGNQVRGQSVSEDSSIEDRNSTGTFAYGRASDGQIVEPDTASGSDAGHASDRESPTIDSPWLGSVSVAVIISLLLVVGCCTLGGLFLLTRG